MENGNILYGKKWVACGDSFTNGDFKNALDTDFVFEDGPYAGLNRVYDRLIAERNHMQLKHLAVGGMTMATPKNSSFTNCFSYETYKNIDADADYITLYFGINDSHHRPKSAGTDGEDERGIIPFGTMEDENVHTFLGAWNVMLRHLKTHYPFAHTGIIISNGCENEDYPLGEIAMAKKWGIPYIDLNGDERTPAMLRTQNPEICHEAKDMLIKHMAVNPGINNHPNAKAHAYESIFIEQWLRAI